LRRKLRKATDERLLYLDFRLTPSDAFLLSRVDGTITAEQMLDQSTVPRDEAKASLAGLLAVGAIEYVDAPPPTSVTTRVAQLQVTRLAARINSPDPFEILGVRSDVSNDELRSAYLKLLRSCDPAATADPKLRPILARMCEQLAEAFKEIERRRGSPRREALRKAIGGRPVTATPPQPGHKASPPAVPALPTVDPARASAAGPSVDPMMANEAAAQAFEEGRFHEALAILHDAIPLLEGRARRSARVKKARVLLAVENGARLAEDELKLAVAEDPGNAEAHAVLGRIYHEKGSLALATMEYRKALDLEPRNALARDALQHLRAAPKGPAPDASVLKRIFGRNS
jgi:DnaJ-domain-containing protein 1